MDFRQLSYFKEVAEQGGFTRASQALHLSQSTLSKVVKSLEEELGVELFDRSARQIELTDAGETVLAEARAILASLDHLTDSLYGLQQLKKGTVRLGMPPIIGTLYFPGIIADFRRRYPGINIRLTEGGSKRVEEAVQRGDVDLGLVVLPVEEEQFDIQPFLRERLAIIAAKDSPLAGRDSVALPELVEEPLIVLREGFAIYGSVREAYERLGHEPHIVYESAQWDFIGEMVAEGLGISYLPESLCRRLDPQRIRTIRLEQPEIPYHVAVITRKGRYLSFAAREFLAHLGRERE